MTEKWCEYSKPCLFWNYTICQILPFSCIPKHKECYVEIFHVLEYTTLIQYIQTFHRKFLEIVNIVFKNFKIKGSIELGIRLCVGSETTPCWISEKKSRKHRHVCRTRRDMVCPCRQNLVLQFMTVRHAPSTPIFCSWLAVADAATMGD
jgi:hypothetical protein